MIDISVIIPTFNGEETIERLYSRLSLVLIGLKKTYEIIFVDDGSTDRTFEILKELNQQDERIRIIKLSRNFGQHAALQAGIKNMQGRILITLDDDLQNSPEDIPSFLEQFYKGCDIVCGWRIIREVPLFTRMIPSYIINVFLSIFIGVRLHDIGCFFKVRSLKVVEDMIHSGSCFNLLSEFRRYKICELKICSNQHRKSRYNFIKLMELGLALFSGALKKGWILNTTITLSGLLLTFLGTFLFFISPDEFNKMRALGIFFITAGFIILIFGFLLQYLKHVAKMQYLKTNFEIREII
jgi:glycosyltransferase involved in cell wall biosynthesis